MSRGDERLAFEEVLPRIAELAERLAEHDDSDVAATAIEMLDWIDVFHANGVGRMVEMLREWRGEILLEAVAADPIAGALLRAYGLGDGADLDAARVSVQAALAEVRPYLHSHGGDMEVVHIEDGVVRLKLHGSCDGCTASDATIIEQVETALQEHWVDFRRIEVEEMTAAPHPPPVVGSITTGLQITRRSDD
ncbi:MAG: NifU family protein [Acidimicrobiia bacterium]|nr:NifU family protein [Acidimicrobiia bacterium]